MTWPLHIHNLQLKMSLEHPRQSKKRNLNTFCSFSNPAGKLPVISAGKWNGLKEGGFSREWHWDEMWMRGYDLGEHEADKS